MKKLLWLLLVTLLAVGCRSGGIKPVILHPTLGTGLIIVPKGTQVGEHKAPDDGVYMTRDVFTKMIAEVVEEAKKSKELYW